MSKTMRRVVVTFEVETNASEAALRSATMTMHQHPDLLAYAASFRDKKRNPAIPRDLAEGKIVVHYMEKNTVNVIRSSTTPRKRASTRARGK